jgi:hypothetical protein
MTAHRVNRDLGEAIRLGFAVGRNPGTGGTLDLEGKSDIGFTLSAGTYKVDNATAFTTIKVLATGAVTLTNKAGTALATMVNGDLKTFTATSASTWKLIGGSGYGYIDIPLNSFREVASGDVGNTAANGGVLASDTTPILQGGGTTNAQRLNWATGNVDAVASAVSLPGDLDGSQDLLVQMFVQGDVDGFNGASVVSNFDDGANVTDSVTATNGATVHTASATIAASDVADTPRTMSLTIAPPTHDTDAVYLYGVRVRYTKL